jgi:VIT1/CCC1 family predicted Fe2+/Mn2+ transporter
VALGVSALTSNSWTILISGLIVGIASSFANAFGPLITKGRLLSSQVYSVNDLIHSTISFLLTFIIIGLPIIPYLINNLNIARVVSVITGLVLLFVFGVHKGQLEHLGYESPLVYGFKMALIGAAIAMICYLVAFYSIR